MNSYTGGCVKLLVVKSAPFSVQRSRLREVNRLYMSLRKMPVATDLLLYSLDEFEQWKVSLNHVVGRAHRAGRMHHARP